MNMWYRKKKKEKIPLFDKTISVKKQPDLKNKLDRIYSEFIRLRDSNNEGYGKCISCGKIVHWKNGDAGHYINRAVMSTRYCEKNVHLQCQFDNRFREGNMLGYTKGLIKKYGPGILDELEVLKSSTSHLSNFEYELLIKHYQNEVKRLLKAKSS